MTSSFLKRGSRLGTQTGVTLVELLVAMTVGLLVTIVALSMLVLGRTGYDSVDNTSQLLDKERFATDLISRIVAQAGFQDLGADPLALRSAEKDLGQEPEPDIFGWDNAIWKKPDNLLVSEIPAADISDGNRPGKCTFNDTSCKNGSDILVIRFQGVGPAPSGDGTMVNCLGLGERGPGGVVNDRAASAFYVDRIGTATEPSLYCARYNFTSGGWSVGQPVIEGVEGLQILYGTDSVTPSSSPTAAVMDTVADRWLRADQLKVAGNLTATKENWRRVRAIRVGLVFRGPVGSLQNNGTSSVKPLGASYVAAADTGSQLALAADGRLRKVANFTVHVRNDLSTKK